MERIIYLQEVGKLNQSVFIKLKNNLERELKEFNIRVKLNKDQITLTDSEYNNSKKKFNASKILKKIKRKYLKKDFFRILGTLDEDIYTKNYHFVFGSANMNPGIGLISLTRLRKKFYKGASILYKKNETRKDIEDRILKEAIHELGHTFGLKHCMNFCVMRNSNSLKDIDKKSLKFCDSCLNLLRGVLNQFNI